MQQSKGAGSAYFILLAVAVWLAFVAGLHVFPLLFPPDPGLPNAAAALGYNVKAAYLAFAAIAAIAGLSLAYYGPNMGNTIPPEPAPAKSPRLLL